MIILLCAVDLFGMYSFQRHALIMIKTIITTTTASRSARTHARTPQAKIGAIFIMQNWIISVLFNQFAMEQMETERGIISR